MVVKGVAFLHLSLTAEWVLLVMEGDQKARFHDRFHQPWELVLGRNQD